MNWKKIVGIAFILALVIFQIFYWWDPITLQDVVAIRRAIFNFIYDYPFLSAVLYILTFVLTIIFGIPLSATAIGGFLFGTWLGTLYSMIGVAIGSFALCSLARYVFRDYVQRNYGDKLEDFTENIRKYGLFYITFIHMIPFFPSFLPHIASGISPITLYKIVLANIIGGLPMTIVYSYAGNYLQQIHSWQQLGWLVVIAGIVIGLSFSAYYGYQFFIKEKK